MRYRQYRRGVQLSGIVNADLRFSSSPGLRGGVTDFRLASKRRLAWIYMQGDWQSMLTLTYHNDFPVDFSESKRQLNTVLQYLRDHFVKYLWVVEWQKRGVPHYHIWMDKRFDDVPVWEDTGLKSWRGIALSWLKVTKQDNDQAAVEFALHQRCYTDWNVDIRVNYAKKYASKNLQKALPEGIKTFGRWWGCSRNLELAQQDVILNQKDFPKENMLYDWVMFRRQVKKFIERKFKFRFSHDLLGSCMPIRFTLSEDRVECVDRLYDYYLYRFRNRKIPF
jgi:hypothetical protein